MEGKIRNKIRKEGQEVKNGKYITKKLKLKKVECDTTTIAQKLNIALFLPDIFTQKLKKKMKHK